MKLATTVSALLVGNAAAFSMSMKSGKSRLFLPYCKETTDDGKKKET
jgi:hypothetical protein